MRIAFGGQDGPASSRTVGLVPAPGILLFDANPGAGAAPLPAVPAWWWDASLIPVGGLKSVTSVTQGVFVRIIFFAATMIHLVFCSG